MVNSSCTVVNITEPGPATAGQLGIWSVLGLHIGFGVVAGIVSKFSTWLRARLFKSSINVDTDFDAGGKVSAGLTATTIVSQWTWAATLLQSSAVGAKYGISGPFWYASGATIQILLFSMISAQLRVRAPGAKTFLQVIRARFGSTTHIVFCVFALLTNVIVTAMLMLGGAAVMTNMVNGLSVEYATGLVAAVIGTYTYIGGLGGTFYVSYLCTATIFIILITFAVKVFYTPGDVGITGLGSIEEVYRYISCSTGPDGNVERSYLTILSNPGLMFGVINIVGNFGTVFVDQSYWQSSVAAKPKQGVWGFLIGGLVWFAVPFSFATTMGLGYVALSGREGHQLLPPQSVDAGLVAPTVAQKLMGSSGEMMVASMILMAVTSTGSAEVIAVTSIMIYDLYQLYLKPYRLVHDANSCILCGRSRGRNASIKDNCKCHSMTVCADCTKDDQTRTACRRALKPNYKCHMHGSYREYNDYLVRLKDQSIVWCTLAIIPLTLILNSLNVKLGWLYLFMGILIGSAVVPIILSMFWSRLTGPAMTAGAISGAVVGLVTWLVVSSTYPGGLSNFMENTGREVSMLVGNLAAIGTGAVVTIVYTLVSSIIFGSPPSHETWEKTRDIDNPLSPWTELYQRELSLDGAYKLDNRPQQDEVSFAFKGARLVANICGPLFTFVLVILWPAAMASIQVLSETQFRHWVNSAHAWAFIATIVMIVLPLVNEAADTWRSYKESQKIGDLEIETQRVQANRVHCSTGKNYEFTGENTNGTDQEAATTSVAIFKTTSVKDAPDDVTNVKPLDTGVLSDHSEAESNTVTSHI